MKGNKQWRLEECFAFQIEMAGLRASHFRTASVITIFSIDCKPLLHCSFGSRIDTSIHRQ